MSVYVGPISAAPNNQYQLAIYTDSGGGPGTLVAQSASGQLTANAWNTLPISASPSPNTSYWLVYNTNGADPSVNNMAYSNGDTSAWRNASTPFGAWPAAFGSASVVSTTSSIYMTYTH